jgi:predicted outer membrane protein
MHAVPGNVSRAKAMRPAQVARRSSHYEVDRYEVDRSIGTVASKPVLYGNRERNILMDRRNALAIFFVALSTPRLAMAAKEKISSGSEHAEQTLAVGTIALKTSELAKEMGKDAWVKRFAKYEVAEQTTIAEILKSMGFEPHKNEEATEMVEKLKKSSDFDADYVTAQIEGHEKLLKIQEDYIGAESEKNRAGLDVAKLARAQIKEHIDLLQTIQKTLKS